MKINKNARRNVRVPILSFLTQQSLSYNSKSIGEQEGHLLYYKQWENFTLFLSKNFFIEFSIQNHDDKTKIIIEDTRYEFTILRDWNYSIY